MTEPRAELQTLGCFTFKYGRLHILGHTRIRLIPSMNRMTCFRTMGAYKQKQDVESILCHWEIHDATLWRFGPIAVYWSVLRWIYLFYFT